jgi:hypothetical protein
MTYTYPLQTPGSESVKGDYLNRLSNESETILSQIENWVEEFEIDISVLNLFSLSPKLTILRYLRANQFDKNKTIEHIKKNISWREEIQIKTLIHQNPIDILKCQLEELISVFPHWQLLSDKFGR